jgi:hypothetical protein
MLFYMLMLSSVVVVIKGSVIREGSRSGDDLVSDGERSILVELLELYINNTQVEKKQRLQ